MVLRSYCGWAIHHFDKTWHLTKRHLLDSLHLRYCAAISTIYQNGELPNRNMSEVPHPFIAETMDLFKNSKEKSKIKFIHFNHTNPVMRQTKERADVLKQGFGVCTEGEVL